MLRPMGVAGVYPPAFVERPSLPKRSRGRGDVSPEFTLRPSLSEQHVAFPTSTPTMCRRSLPSGLR